MRKILRWASALAVVTLVGIQFVRPARTNPVTDPTRTMAARTGVTPEAAAVLARACRDCHSNDTRWPWYSNVAPVSWFVIDHVNHGRRHFNYSEWAKYDPGEARNLLKDVCGMSRKETMPLSSYTWMHRQARLSDDDVAALCDWSDDVLRAARK